MGKSHEQRRNVMLFENDHITSLIAVNKRLEKSKFQEGEFVLTHSSGAAHPGREVMEEGACLRQLDIFH